MAGLSGSIGEFVETLSSENSDLIDDVRSRSKAVLNTLQDTIAQQNVVPPNLLQTVMGSLSDPSPSIPPMKKGLVAGAGIDEHIVWLQNDINTYMLVISGFVFSLLASRVVIFSKPIRFREKYALDFIPATM
jgi:hypothetical protein